MCLHKILVSLPFSPEKVVDKLRAIEKALANKRDQFCH